MKKKASRPSALSSPATSRTAAKQAGNLRDGSFLGWCSDHERLCFAIAAAVWVLVLYWKAIGAPFVYDDLDQIVNNPSLHSWHTVFTRFFLSPVSFTTNFFAGGGSTYRPLYWFTLALDRQLWGVNGASGFHFTNLVFHWANGVFLFLLLRRVNVSALVASVASLAWLGLPINTEAVAWVSGRAYLLSTFFILLSLLAAYSYASKEKPITFVSYFVLALGALLSHEEGLALLPLTLLLLYVMNQHARRVWGQLAGAAFVADIFYVVVKYRVGAHSGQGAPTPWSVGLVFWKYLLWIVAPIHMSVERSTSVPLNSPSVAAIAAWVAMLALVGVAFLLRRKRPIVVAGIACGCVALLPFCGVVSIYQGMAERFLYLASIGFTLSIVSMAIANRKVWKGTAVAVLLLWMLWGAGRLMARVLDWDDPVSLYRNSLVATPHSPTLFGNLGFSLRERGDLDGALDDYREDIRIRPNDAKAFTGIGDIYQQRGKPEEAIKAYVRSLALQPDDANTVINYAVVLEQAGEKQLAEQQFRRTMALAPKDAAAYVDLGALYVQENRQDEAIQCFQQAIAINPDDANPYFNLATLFQYRGRDDLALPLYRKVLLLKPGDPDTLENMAKLHVQPGTN